EPVRALIFIAALFATQALAQQWPQKPVRLVVPFPPGGVTDSIARITVDWLAPRLGQPVIAENKPGASGAIAAEFVARSAPDGYTLFMAASPQLAIVPHVQKIPYDPVKDFAPVSIVGASAFGLRVLAVSGGKRASQLPDVQTVAEQGYPGFRTETWNGVVAPAGTAQEIVERVAREIALGCRDAGFVGRLDRIGVDAVCSTPAEFAGAIRQDLELWKEAVRAAGIQ